MCVVFTTHGWSEPLSTSITPATRFEVVIAALGDSPVPKRLHAYLSSSPTLPLYLASSLPPPAPITLLPGGFGLYGVPDTLVNPFYSLSHVTNLTAVSNNAGIEGSGLGGLFASKQINKIIASFVGEKKGFEKIYLPGELELELTPQGTLAESQNFTGVMARNAKITIVEAEHIVEPGDIVPGAVHLPGIYATHVIQSDTEKRIEKLPYSKEENPAMEALGPGDTARKRERISENGIVGLGPYPREGTTDPDLIDAGKGTVTLRQGASYFESEETFGVN
ncbi:MAG: hypothetical protein Q9188_004030 [Gyalolechia gomerana]